MRGAGRVGGAFVASALIAGGLPTRSAAAQEKDPDLRRREASFRQYLAFPSLIEGGVVVANWMADGTRFWYLAGSEANRRIYLIDPATSQRADFFDVPRLRASLASLASLLGQEPAGRGVPFATFQLTNDERTARFTIEGAPFELDRASYQVRPVARSADLAPLEGRAQPRVVRWSTWVGPPPFREVPSPDRRWLLFDRDGDLWLRSAEDDLERRLTTDAEPDNGWSFPGSLWSPDGRTIATQRVDERGLVKSPVVHWLGPKETVDWWYYPDPGDPLPQTGLYLLDVARGPPIPIDVGAERDQSLDLLHWRPDGSEVLFTAQDRARKRLELKAANRRTGSTRTILTDRAVTFVEFRGFHPLAKSDRFLWISERDGWAQLYLYGLDGTLQRQLTRGELPVAQILAVDETKGWVYYLAPAEPGRPYDSHLHRVSLDGSGQRRLTDGVGQHQVQLSPSREVFLDTHSSLSRPPVVELRRVDGTLLQTLDRANVDRVKALGWRPPEEFVVKAADGATDLHGVLYVPMDLDRGQKYPVIDHLYGGPQATWAPRTYDQEPHGVLAQALAQMGFVVFIVDGRGTPGRGKAFQDVVYGKVGRNEIPDHVAALRQLAKDRPYMDLERVGAFGSSWGGYFTLRAMLLAPEVYRAGVAGAPVANSTHFLGHEIYNGLLADNPEGYAYGSNTNLASRLAGNLLIMIGTSDQNVKFAAPMQMAEALIRAGKYFDLIVMPERTHHYGYTRESRTWYQRDYFVEAIRRHFVKYLRREEP